MKNKIFQGVISGLFLLIITFPLAQQITNLAPEPRLQEKRILASMPPFTVDSLVSGEFQNQFDKFMNDNFGFRGWVVLINNQINISIFHVTR